MNVNRNIVKFVDNKQNNYEQPVTLYPSKSISFVWELTEEIYSLSGRFSISTKILWIFNIRFNPYVAHY